MSEDRKLPIVLQRRVEQILGRKVEATYRTNDPNTLRATTDGEDTYVNLATKQEVPSEALSAEVQKERKGGFTSLISRKSLADAVEAKQKENQSRSKKGGTETTDILPTVPAKKKVKGATKTAVKSTSKKSTK